MYSGESWRRILSGAEGDHAKEEQEKVIQTTQKIKETKLIKWCVSNSGSAKIKLADIIEGIYAG